MTAIKTGLAINTATSGDRTTAQGMRIVLSSLFKSSAPGVITSGIIYSPGNPLLVTTDVATLTYHVAAGFAAMYRSGQGVYWAGSNASVDVTTTAGDATNPRYDRIYIWQPDPELADSGTAQISVVNGTPGSNPTLPSIPTGALELARKLVPAGASNTAAGTALTNYAAYTTLGVDYTQLLNLPSTFAPSAHTHVVSEITDLATNGNVAKIGGKKITVDPTTAPTSPANGDVWISYTP